MRVQRLRPTAQYTRAFPGFMLMNMRQRFFLPRTWSSRRRPRSRQAMAAATSSTAASSPRTSFFRFASIAQIYLVVGATRTSAHRLQPYQPMFGSWGGRLILPFDPEDHDIIVRAIGYERGQQMIDQALRRKGHRGRPTQPVNAV